VNNSATLKAASAGHDRYQASHRPRSREISLATFGSQHQHSRSFRQRHASDTVVEDAHATEPHPEAGGNVQRQGRLSLAPVVSAARVDPFNCWPVAWNRDLEQNFRFLINAFGPSMFGYMPNNNGFDIFRTQAQLVLTDPAAFHSLMILSTLRQGQIAGKTLPGMSALWHRIEALRLIKERIESGDMDKCTSEGSIYAVMCLMGIGAGWNAVDQNEFDSSALNRLVLLKGGLSVLSQAHPVLEMSLFGMAVLTPGLLRSDLYTVNELSVTNQQGQDAKVLLYSLLGFLRGTSGLRRKSPSALGRVQAMFAPGTPTYSLLTYTPDHPGVYDHRQQILRKRLRQHIMLYTFSVLLYASPYQVEEFVEHLQFVLRHSGIWQHSLRMFGWALIADVPKGALMFPAQAWQSYEMLCAVHCLEEDLQNDIVDYCLNLLTGEVQASQSVNELMGRVRLIMFRPFEMAIDAVHLSASSSLGPGC